MVFHSLKARELAFESTPRPSSASSKDLSVSRRGLIAVLLTTWDRAFGPNGPFGLNGKYFEVAFGLRETLEIVMQTYQAYHLSLSVPRRWINQLAVASIVLNCVGTPVLHVAFRRKRGWRRLLCLVQDAVLDVCSSVVIPVCVIYPYVFKYFDRSVMYFPDALIMDDVWYIDAISENRQILITSTADYMATVMPQLSILGCLVTVKQVIKSRRAGVAPQPAGPPRHSATRVVPLGQPEANPRGAEMASSTSSSFWGRLRGLASAQTIRLHRFRQRNERIMHAVLLLWAVVVVSLHVDAEARATHTVRGCRSHVQPWYAAKYACSVMQFNCYSRGIRGDPDELSAELERLEPSALRILVVTHCSALSLPPTIRVFQSMKGIEIYNSSLTVWPSAAAVDAASHKELGYLYLINTTWSQFPEGVFHGRLPPTLTHLIIHGSNFTALPEGLEELWAGRLWVLLAIERTPLQALPPSFCRLSIYQISLAATQLAEIPDHCFHDDMIAINLSGSRLRALPVQESALPSKQMLTMELSALLELPAWFERWLEAGGSAATALYGSPVCASLRARDDANATTWIGEVCGADYQTWEGTYPWQLMLPQRQLDF
ncbi:hypothetical protein ATCC90586_009527 [Pythium insidiosum]|nr:hypothetical protein ATCC90586_009527 [Pythium insidiosum]